MRGSPKKLSEGSEFSFLSNERVKTIPCTVTEPTIQAVS